MNSVTLCGNLTRDPEQRFTPQGTAISTFGLALNRRTKDASGQPKDEVTFVDVTALGKTAENITQYFRKGSKMLMTGRLKLDQWDDKKTGDKRSKLSVVLESFEFVESRQSDDHQRSATQTRPAKQNSPQRTPATKESGWSEPPEPNAVPPEDESDPVPF